MELEQRLTTLTVKAKEAEDAKGMISRIQPNRRIFRNDEVHTMNPSQSFLEFFKDSIQVRLDDISKSSKDNGKKIKDLEKEKKTNDLKIQQMEKVNIKPPYSLFVGSIRISTLWSPVCTH